MKISPSLFEAFLKCPTKCWRRAQGEIGDDNAYATWVREQTESYAGDAATHLASENAPPDSVGAAPEFAGLKTAKWRLGLDVTAAVQTETCAMESRLHAVERIPSEGRGRAAQFIPIRFIYRNKLTRDDKLLLTFDAYVLGEALGRDIALGKIIHGDDHATLKVKISALAGEVRKRLEKATALLSSPAPPDLVLNRHCAECEFQAR